jgi:hypothetical protein
MELTKREIEIIFNALGRLHDSVIDGFYNYHSEIEILELQEKFEKEMKRGE